MKDMRNTRLIPDDSTYTMLYDAFVSGDGNFRSALRTLDQLSKRDLKRRRNQPRVTDTYFAIATLDTESRASPAQARP